MKNPRFADDSDFGETVGPDPDKIPCRNCALRAEDSKFGSFVEPGCISAKCQVYDIKPSEILLEYKECPYHVAEDNPEEDE